jgi:alpha-L-fucosidase
MTRYGKIDLLWHDGCIPEPLDGIETNALVKRLQPHIMINNRAGEPCDFYSCEQAIKPAAPGRRWEACMTLNDNWGYHAGDSNWKTPRQVIRMLLETSGNAGNLLLNVGPRADGTIPEESERILREAGDWLRRNREFLPDSERSPFSWNNWGRVTTRGNHIYLHIINSTGPTLRQPDIKNRVLRAFCLDGGREVPFVQEADMVTLRDLPVPLRDPIATTIVLEVEGAPETTRKQTSFWIPG